MLLLWAGCLFGLLLALYMVGETAVHSLLTGDEFSWSYAAWLMASGSALFSVFAITVVSEAFQWFGALRRLFHALLIAGWLTGFLFLHDVSPNLLYLGVVVGGLIGFFANGLVKLPVPPKALARTRSNFSSSGRESATADPRR